MGRGNLEVIHTVTSILYDWNILGSSIYIVDIFRIDDLRINNLRINNLRINDLRIDDQSSILRSSIYRVIAGNSWLRKSWLPPLLRLKSGPFVGSTLLFSSLCVFSLDVTSL